MDEFAAQFDDERMGEQIEAEVASGRRTGRARRWSGRSSRSPATAPEEIFVEPTDRGRVHHRGQGGPTTMQCLVPVTTVALVVGRRRGRVSGSAAGRRYFTPMRVGDRRCDAVGGSVEHGAAAVAAPPDHRRGAAAVEVERVLGAELLAAAGPPRPACSRGSALDRPSTTSSRIRPVSRSMPTAVRGCSSRSFSTMVLAVAEQDLLAADRDCGPAGQAPPHGRARADPHLLQLRRRPGRGRSAPCRRSACRRSGWSGSAITRPSGSRPSGRLRLAVGDPVAGGPAPVGRVDADAGLPDPRVSSRW